MKTDTMFAREQIFSTNRRKSRRCYKASAEQGHGKGATVDGPGRLKVFARMSLRRLFATTGKFPPALEIMRDGPAYSRKQSKVVEAVRGQWKIVGTFPLSRSRPSPFDLPPSLRIPSHEHDVTLSLSVSLVHVDGGSQSLPPPSLSRSDSLSPSIHHFVFVRLCFSFLLVQLVLNVKPLRAADLGSQSIFPSSSIPAFST